MAMLSSHFLSQSLQTKSSFFIMSGSALWLLLSFSPQLLVTKKYLLNDNKTEKTRRTTVA